MKYIFIHIGKTAGTSFRTFLESNVKRPYWGYGKTHFLTHENLDIRNPSKFIEVEPYGYDVFKYFDLFSEHAPYGLHKHLNTKNYQYITILREPLKRTISSYRYAKDRGWIYNETKILDWAKKEKHILINYQLNYVSGVPIDAPYEVKLKHGLKNLRDDKFLFGLTEKYNEFIDLCCEKNSWTPQYKKVNVTQSKNTVTDEEKEKLKELLSEEIKFYNEAVKIYNEKYKKITK
jgi:hypothetical protein